MGGFINMDGSGARVVSMQPVEAFYHPRFGVVVVFRVKCDPPIRDYVWYRLKTKLTEQNADVTGFIQGYTGKSPEELPHMDATLN